MAVNPLNTPSPRGMNGGRFYAFPSVPTLIDCQFTVQKADSGGLGITGLAGLGVNTVFMNTSASAGTGPNGVVNPLAQAASDGLIKIQLANSYARILSLSMIVASPVTGGNLAAGGSALTVGTPYIITVVGTTTQAEWEALGLDKGVVPAVGCSLVALATGSGSGSGQVKAVGFSGASNIEIISQSSPSANPQLHPLASGGLSPNIGAIILGKFISSSAGVLTMDSYTPVGTVAAPVFTGDALAVHSHTIPSGTDSGGGVSGDTSGGTPSGTNSAPVFTGTAHVLTGSVSAGSEMIVQPANGSIVYLSMIVSQR